jgi:hypothetical protein
MVCLLRLAGRVAADRGTLSPDNNALFWGGLFAASRGLGCCDADE